MNTTKRKLTPDVKAARRALRQKGYTYETAAPLLGVTVPHLGAVLTCNGRTSLSLLKRIHQLPNLRED